MTSIRVAERFVIPFLGHSGIAADDTRRDSLVDALVSVFLEEGFRHLSLNDMARRLHCSKSTLYLIASSKERIIVAVVRRFFRRAAERVERRVELSPVGSIERLQTYMSAISTELAPVSGALFADVDAFPAAREIYQLNTVLAARRVQELVIDAVPATSRDRAVFIGAVAAQTMEAIHRGEIGASTGLGDSAAYRALSDLIVAATDTDSEIHRGHADRRATIARSER
ncbi:MAG: TetR/AcrR family transcriptional regulator [Protaetiibacter sp.]